MHPESTYRRQIRAAFDLDAAAAVTGYLRDLGVGAVRLLTNNPRKLAGLSGYGMTIAERVPLIIEPKEQNKHYLNTKKAKLGHMLDD